MLSLADGCTWDTSTAVALEHAARPALDFERSWVAASVRSHRRPQDTPLFEESFTVSTCLFVIIEAKKAGETAYINGYRYRIRTTDETEKTLNIHETLFKEPLRRCPACRRGSSHACPGMPRTRADPRLQSREHLGERRVLQLETVVTRADFEFEFQTFSDTTGMQQNCISEGTFW